MKYYARIFDAEPWCNGIVVFILGMSCNLQPRGVQFLGKSR